MRLRYLLRKLLRRFWASAFCSLLLLIPAWAQRESPPIVLAAGGGIALGVGASEFFDGYRAVTGLRANDFDVPTVVAGMLLIDVGGVRIGTAIEHFRARFLERGSPQTAPQRVLEEDAQLQATPLLLTVEWEPWRDQFRTYLITGVGAAFARFQWYERAWTDGQLQRSSVLVDLQQTVPAVRLGAGTYLFFDTDQAASLRGGLALQLCYTYSPVRLAVFDRYANGTTNQSWQQWTGDITVGGSALVLSLSVRFQIGHQR
ncbi:MAG: hypothetical protein N2663_06230 [Chlorobi bacterium]|nr:hypothetical protein [Chlorobiota bacterium]